MAKITLICSGKWKDNKPITILGYFKSTSNNDASASSTLETVCNKVFESFNEHFYPEQDPWTM